MAKLFGDFQRNETVPHSFSRLFAEFNLHTRDSSRSPDVEQGGFAKGGYFVFPPSAVKANERIPVADTSVTSEQAYDHVRRRHSGDASHQSTHDDEPAEKDARVVEEDEAEQRQINEKRKRLEKEREVASVGEFEWVRSGGVLRDAQGRRDKVCTESIRQEIRLRGREKLLTERWEIYERKWHALLAADDPVTFKAIPWPLPTCPSAVKDLNYAAISAFLLEPLEVRTNTITKRSRIRTSLLRWHPDKMSSILCRVAEDDVDIVREGISAVFTCLKRIKHEGELK